MISADNEIWAIGMRSISSTLREAGHRTTMIFAGESKASINETALQQIAAIVDSEIIGITHVSRFGEVRD
jgi:hypothetical protein